MQFSRLKQSPLYVIAYDISSNTERSRVDKLLQDYGFRVQRSVFECRLTRKDKKRLFAELHTMKIETGHIRCYSASNSKKIGAIPKEIDANQIYFIE